MRMSSMSRHEGGRPGGWRGGEPNFAFEFSVTNTSPTFNMSSCCLARAFRCSSERVMSFIGSARPSHTGHSTARTVAPRGGRTPSGRSERPLRHAAPPHRSHDPSTSAGSHTGLPDRPRAGAVSSPRRQRTVRFAGHCGTAAGLAHVVDVLVVQANPPRLVSVAPLPLRKRLTENCVHRPLVERRLVERCHLRRRIWTPLRERRIRVL